MNEKTLGHFGKQVRLERGESAATERLDDRNEASPNFKTSLRVFRLNGHYDFDKEKDAPVKFVKSLSDFILYI